MSKLLLLHGALGTRSQFTELEKVLMDTFETYHINFTGHGTGLMPAGRFSIETFAGDIDRWQKENNIETIDMFGYSMGGYAALYFARQFPERAGKIFTLATKFDWSPETAEREVKMLSAKKIKEKVPEFAEELVKRHGSENWEQVLEKTAEMMTELGSKNALTQDDFTMIKNEVLIGIGDRDKMVTLEESITVYRKLKNGNLLVLPDTPHPLEQVDIVKLANEIRIFFNR